MRQNSAKAHVDHSDHVFGYSQIFHFIGLRYLTNQKPFYKPICFVIEGKVTVVVVCSNRCHFCHRFQRDAIFDIGFGDANFGRCPDLLMEQAQSLLHMYAMLCDVIERL